LGFFVARSHAQFSTIPPAEHIQCLDQTEAALNACHVNAFNASFESNNLSAQNAARAGKDSLNQAADREAATTKKIADVLGSALSICQSAAQKCQSPCPGRYAVLGQACAKDVGKYIDELQRGLNENMRGNRGSLASDGASTGRGGTGSAGTAGSGAGRAGVAPGAAGPGSRSNSNSYGNPGNILQRNVAGDDSSSGGGKRGLAGAGGDGSDSEKSYPTFRSPGYGTASAGSQMPGDYHEARRQALRRALQGAELDAALAHYCRTNGAGDEECGRILSEQFCASSDKSGCPTCQKKSPDSYAESEIGKVCVAACIRDPQYGLQLANRCRAHMEASIKGESPGRGLASAESAGGSSIFRIVSETIQNRCRKGKLNCGF